MPDQGNASVPPGTRVYAIGDSHGCVDKLRALHAAIRADSRKSGAGGAAPRRYLAVYLGDYIDRGPASRDLVDLLLEQPLRGFESVYLKGNHEDFLLRFLDSGKGADAWLMNGGDATLFSYGVDPFAEFCTSGPAGLRAALSAHLPDAHLRFFAALRLSHVEGDYLFVHAGIRPGLPLEAQSERDLLWIREPFLTAHASHGKVVVHGHTPSHVPEIRDNRIGIDTGAVFGGPLTALVLEGGERRFLQV